MAINRDLAPAALWLLIGAAAIGVCPAAQAAPIQVASATDLDDALSQLARARNIEILFDQAATAGKRASSLAGNLPVDQVLQQLLAGTGLTFRKTEDGTYIISAGVEEGPAKIRYAQLPIEEILVQGNRTQNVDIRRSEDDIQPYQVMGADTIVQAQSANADSLLKSYLTSNMQATSQNQEPVFSEAAVRSQVDMRGLGLDETLVLIDGHRLPTFPQGGLFSQADLNPLPLSLIDRVESLGSSAGGIFGVGAAGGAVNVVIKRQFDGTNLHFDSGISEHGDAWHDSVEGLTGFTIAQTGTSVMIAGGLSKDDGLQIGDRSFVAQTREMAYQSGAATFAPVASPSINFTSVTGENLTLIPALGGTALNARASFLPLNAPAASAGGAALLLGNAGKNDLRLSPDGQGAMQSLVTPSHTSSFLTTIRQDVGDSLELYVDLIWLESSGRAIVPALDTTSNILDPGDPANPFQQTVSMTFPTPGLVGIDQSTSVTERGGIGAIYRLPSGWSVDLDAAMGQARLSGSQTSFLDYPLTVTALQGPAVLNGEIAALTVGQAARSVNTNRMNDFNLRAGGPLWDLNGGPLSLTATLEWFQEENTGARLAYADGSTDREPHYNRQFQSAAMEMRAPLIDKNSNIWELRGLELQLALRADRYTETAPLDSVDFTTEDGTSGVGIAKAGFVSTTFGAKIQPLEGLTVRASVATGYTPPTSGQMQAVSLSGDDSISLFDPKRGGPQSPDVAAGLAYSATGSTSLKPQQTTSYSLGMIVQPEWFPGMRMSVDYSELRTKNEITDFAEGDYQYFVDNEAVYPSRITRAPLTSTDAALGYSAGQITFIDASLLQVGRSVLRAVDFSIGYVRSTAIGVFDVDVKATWEPSFYRRGDPAQPTYNLSGYGDGPLDWKGNFRLGWARGFWSSGLDVQFYDRFNAGYAASFSAVSNSDSVRALLAGGSGIVPAQIYVDWNLAYHHKLALMGSDILPITYRLGIHNIFDSRPPFLENGQSVFDPGGYVGATTYNTLGGRTPYGDPVGRQFELSVSADL